MSSINTQSQRLSRDSDRGSSPPEQLVILAAGMGSRIRAGGVDVPKPLVDVGGLPLLKRAILTATRAKLRAKNGRDVLHRSHLKQIKCA